jgi:hypothetical protein
VYIKKEEAGLNSFSRAGESEPILFTPDWLFFLYPVVYFTLDVFSLIPLDFGL